ncbi:precorrin-2 dehydrogenase/sirohydrochlorin ferrochelatase family protein [Croceibacterium aestuarii]|uniref:precorrin-2 dehydrogenase/sirohydrochlorin ferrochelatase family protein n=1 Tax=Croceibacterium aestuarii TaxID=3064139 RepID=UPI00272E4818|nr:bifunctional precorrin-2 dehydrogenase/sirohydrochlorin ferrochelatase [Croceibacterium sp. D39]
MISLPLFHRVAGKPVLVLGEGTAADAKRRLAERAGAKVIREEAGAIGAGARIGFVAIEDPALAEAAAARLREAGMLVNVVDRPELCDFTTPSVLEREPVQIAIGTGGASAGLAKHLRLRLESILPVSVGRLAQALALSRGAIRARWPGAAERRGALDAALAEGGPLDPLGGAGPEEVERWLASDLADGPQANRIELTVSADPEELTMRQMQLLGVADTILHQAEVPAAILNRARADAMRYPLDAAPSSDPPGLTLVLRTR